MVQAYPLSRPATYSESKYDIVQNELIWNDLRNSGKESNRIWFYEIYSGDEVFSTVESNKAQIIFDTVKTKGPFRVVAVNYCFEKSEPSNAVEFKK